MFVTNKAHCSNNENNNSEPMKTLMKKTIKQCDYNKSLQGKNNKWTVNQWANSQRTSLISIAAATGSQRSCSTNKSAL